MGSSVEQFRRTIVDELIRELIEQKKDSRKFLDDEKRRYDLEHRKVNIIIFHTSLLFSFSLNHIAVKGFYFIGKLHVNIVDEKQKLYIV